MISGNSSCKSVTTATPDFFNSSSNVTLNFLASSWLEIPFPEVVVVFVLHRWLKNLLLTCY